MSDLLMIGESFEDPKSFSPEQLPVNGDTVTLDEFTPNIKIRKANLKINLDVKDFKGWIDYDFRIGQKFKGVIPNSDKDDIFKLVKDFKKV